MTELKRTYYESGNIESEVFIINGKKEGYYKKYYENENIELIFPYIDNKLNGYCKRYGTTGNLHYICNMTNNKKKIKKMKNLKCITIMDNYMNQVSMLMIYDTVKKIIIQD
jgi:antitoxin component YwqK of YwqJK toxin-antitoxin module